MMRITMGNQLHDLYIHPTDSCLIEQVVQLQTNEPFKNKLNCIQYKVSPTDVFPRYQEGEQVEYLFEVSADGYVTNVMNISLDKSRVINITTPRKKTDFDRVKVDKIKTLHNQFNLQRNKCGLDQIYLKSNIRYYKVEYDTNDWFIEFNDLYGNPYKFVDDKDMLYFIDPPKCQCIIYGPSDIPFSTVKKFLQVILPSNYKLKN